MLRPDPNIIWTNISYGILFIYIYYINQQIPRRGEINTFFNID